jgi:hypothetical protein
MTPIEFFSQKLMMPDINSVYLLGLAVAEASTIAAFTISCLFTFGCLFFFFSSFLTSSEIKEHDREPARMSLKIFFPRLSRRPPQQRSLYSASSCFTASSSSSFRCTIKPKTVA